jgi:hypothetical protein
MRCRSGAYFRERGGLGDDETRAGEKVLESTAFAVGGADQSRVEIDIYMPQQIGEEMKSASTRLLSACRKGDVPYTAVGANGSFLGICRSIEQ